MKKTKLALISMIVFISVFSLTAIIDIQRPLFKGRQTEVDQLASTNSDTLVKETQENKIQSFSIEVSPSPTSLDNTSENSTETGKEQAAVTGTVKDNTFGVDASFNPEDSKAAKVSPTTAPKVTAAPKVTEAPVKEESKYSDIGISIAKDYVNLREKASTDSDVLGKLYTGSAVTILKTKGDWYYVESGSVKGYVSTEFIKTGIPDDVLVDKYGTLSISVEVDGLNVREKPSTESKKLTVIYKDETYPVVKVKDDWIKVKIPDDNVTGYVRTEFSELLVEFKEAVSKEEEQLLQQLEAEKRAKKETEIKQQEGRDYSVSDLELLACLVHAEAGSQSYEGKLAVANIVLNRIKSSKYPDSLKSVIYQAGQFTVAASGSLQKQLDSYNNYDSQLQLMSIKAAKDALAGSNNIGARLYFHSYRAAVRKGYDDKDSSVKIGNLLFW